MCEFGLISKENDKVLHDELLVIEPCKDIESILIKKTKGEEK